MGAERLARLSRKVCAFFFAVAVVVCIVSYAAGHGKECVTEMVRVESTDSPLSATLIKKHSKKVQISDKKQKEVAAREVEEKAIKLGNTLRREVG